MFKSSCTLVLGALVTTCALLPSCVWSSTESAEQLKEVQQKIEQRKAILENQQESKSQLEEQVKQTELEIAKLAKEQRLTQDKLTATEKENQRLVAEVKQLENKKQQQGTALEKQLISAYMAGKNEYSKMILSQESPAKLERTLTYYTYLNRARMGQIESFNETLIQLERLQQQVTDNQTQLSGLQQQQQRQLTAIASQQNQRSKALVTLKQHIQSNANELERLQFSEEELKRAIEAAANAAEPIDVPLFGLKDQKGLLPWPAKGRVRNRFGRIRQGQVRWKGVMIEGALGATINSIHSGRVLYSDWLKGFGLLIVIDHGDGYMSLYGHNQALLKSVGEMVNPGDPIALLGQSGGNEQPGLYFEIRHKGNAVNPSGWCIGS